MPSKRTPDVEFRDVAHPINSDARTKVQEAILAAYHQVGEQQGVLEEAAL